MVALQSARTAVNRFGAIHPVGFFVGKCAITLAITMAAFGLLILTANGTSHGCNLMVGNSISG